MAQATAEWAAIYAEHGAAMRATAAAKLGPHLGPDGEVFGKSPDDVVFDVIADLMTTGKVPANPKNLRGFLNTAVRRHAIDLLRRTPQLRKERRYLERPFNDVDATVERRVLAAAAAAALDDLPPAERYAIVHRLMLERPANEVGPELAVKPQRVSQLVSQGLGRLRRLPAFIDLLSPDHPAGPSTAMGPESTRGPS